MKDICFFTYFSDYFFFKQRAFMSVNSFLKYHPDADLYVYRQDYLDTFFVSENPLSRTVEHNGNPRDAWYNIRTVLAKELMQKYKRVVHFDGDVICTARWDEILENDWDIVAEMNHNHFQNSHVQNVTEEMYVQNGILGSSRMEFWETLQEKNKNASDYLYYDCDVLNLLLYNDPVISSMKIKLLDKDKNYYGCKSLGWEHKTYIQDDKLMLDGEQVKAYHHARGSNTNKFNFESVGFPPLVCEWLYELGNKGRSIQIHGL